MKLPLLLALLSAAPAAFAQDEPAPLPPITSSPFYVALQPALMDYVNAYPDQDFYPIGISVGFWGQTDKMPLLGLELNYRTRFSAGETQNGAFISTRDRYRAQATSLLLRTMFIRPNAANPFGLEACGGFTYFRATRHTTTTFRTPSYDSFEEEETFDDGSILLGLSPLIQLSPHWQLTSDFRLQLSLVSPPLTPGSRLGSGVSLGVRYYF